MTVYLLLFALTLVVNASFIMAAGSAAHVRVKIQALEARRDAQQKATIAALSAATQAVEKSEAETEKRFTEATTAAACVTCKQYDPDDQTCCTLTSPQHVGVHENSYSGRQWYGDAWF